MGADSDAAEARDDELLRRFLEGELDESAISELEARLDREPALQRRLGRMAGGEPHDDLPDLGETRVSVTLSDGRGVEDLQSGIELDDVIGKGGMGVVYRGRQASVGRAVAVKTVLDLKRHTGPLLQEAMVTGYLEHPNIVPIHEIVKDARGRPLVVLKHIEGKVWRDTIVPPDHPARKPVEWHVKVLLPVCQALRFAHSRNVVHRDVKPTNVMIGAFDEVYLLDWGLAVYLGEHSRLPTRSKARGVAGTPAYMAPEQFEESADEVGFHTDVYLVGACLFHAINGVPPQPGRQLAQIRAAMLAREELDLSPGTPDELAGIVNKAMALEVGERYASMSDLRGALEAFLEHRGSQRLVERADQSAARMAEAHQQKDAETAERAFFDAAFGFRAALESWSENRSASEGLELLVTQRVEQLIALKAPQAARRALAVVDIPDEGLVQLVERALDEEEANRVRLEDYDLGDNRQVGLQARRLLGALLGATWLVLWTVLGFWPPRTAMPMLLATVAFVVVSVLSIWRVRSVMLEVRLNRYNAYISLCVLVAQLAVLSAAVATDRSVVATLTELLLVWALGAACTAVVVDRRIFPTAIAYGAGFVVCSFFPSALGWALVVGALVMVITSLAINLATERQGHAGVA